MSMPSVDQAINMERMDENARRERIQQLRNTAGVYLLLAALVALLGILSPRSLAPRHLLDIFRQAAPLGIVAVGQTVVLLTAGIDLSVGAVITLTNVVASTLMAAGNQAIPGAVLGSLTIAAAVGLLNGLLVTKGHIPPFVVTLAMGSVIEGAFMAYTGGSPSGAIAPAFRVISEGWIANIFPWSGVIWLGICAFMAIFLHRTVFGRQIYAVGGNPRAALLAGIRPDRMTVVAYLISSLSAGIAGLILSAYIGLASTTLGGDYTLDSLAAAVIGGAAFTGGEGGVAGPFAGALIMVFLQSILTVLNLGESGKLVCQGVVIIAMVAIYQSRSRK